MGARLQRLRPRLLDRLRHRAPVPRRPGRTVQAAGERALQSSHLRRHRDHRRSPPLGGREGAACRQRPLGLGRRRPRPRRRDDLSRGRRLAGGVSQRDPHAQHPRLPGEHGSPGAIGIGLHGVSRPGLPARQRCLEPDAELPVRPRRLGARDRLVRQEPVPQHQPGAAPEDPGPDLQDQPRERSARAGRSRQAALVRAGRDAAPPQRLVRPACAPAAPGAWSGRGRARGSEAAAGRAGRRHATAPRHVGAPRHRRAHGGGSGRAPRRRQRIRAWLGDHAPGGGGPAVRYRAPAFCRARARRCVGAGEAAAGECPAAGAGRAAVGRRGRARRPRGRRHGSQPGADGVVRGRAARRAGHAARPRPRGGRRAVPLVRLHRAAHRRRRHTSGAPRAVRSARPDHGRRAPAFAAQRHHPDREQTRRLRRPLPRGRSPHVQIAPRRRSRPPSSSRW